MVSNNNIKMYFNTALTGKKKEKKGMVIITLISNRFTHYLIGKVVNNTKWEIL